MSSCSLSASVAYQSANSFVYSNFQVTIKCIGASYEPSFVKPCFATGPDGTDGGNALDSQPLSPQAVLPLRLLRLSGLAGRLALGGLVGHEEESGVSRSPHPQVRPASGPATPRPSIAAVRRPSFPAVPFSFRERRKLSGRNVAFTARNARLTSYPVRFPACAGP